MTLYQQKNYQKAIPVMEDALKNNPATAEYHRLLGLCQAELPSMKRQAEQNLAKAAALEPWNAEHVVALGMLFYRERLFKRAEGFFRKALELEPKHELAGKKLVEIAGPEKTRADRMKEKGQDLLKKVLPSFFGRRKH
jgi:tetratricopeptide (TPR) repeat protein